MADHITVLTENPTYGGNVNVMTSNGTIQTGTYYGGTGGVVVDGKVYY